MGYLHHGGYLFVVDRPNDMILPGREPAYSNEVENARYRHGDLQEVAVLGIPDERWGEAVTAVVNLRPGSTVTGDELREHTRELIAGYKVPRTVHIIDQPLPKSGAGKHQTSPQRGELATRPRPALGDSAEDPA